MIKKFWKREKNYLAEKVIELNTIDDVKDIFGWNSPANYMPSGLELVRFVEDVNKRRVRDAEVIATSVTNLQPKRILEVGTSKGEGTVTLHYNSPYSQIVTINILPNQIANGEGGVNTTHALKREEIGQKYKEKNLPNIQQVYQNTADWEPGEQRFNLAFIDGSHDAEFVVNDTIKAMKNMKKGDFVLWHDFNPDLRLKFHWINDVCRGVNLLYKKGILKERIFVLKDSWIGIYKV